MALAARRLPSAKPAAARAMRISAARAIGRDFNVSATPSFIIGGRLYPGVLAFERFADLVRPLLPPGAAPRG